jgi:hypothetical protein
MSLAAETLYRDLNDRIASLAASVPVRSIVPTDALCRVIAPFVRDMDAELATIMGFETLTRDIWQQSIFLTGKMLAIEILLMHPPKTSYPSAVKTSVNGSPPEAAIEEMLDVMLGMKDAFDDLAATPRLTVIEHWFSRALTMTKFTVSLLKDDSHESLKFRIDGFVQGMKIFCGLVAHVASVHGHGIGAYPIREEILEIPGDPVT